MTTTHIVQTEGISDDFFNTDGIVHFGDANEWLALCGLGWLQISNDSAEVTCEGCLEELEQEAQF